MCSPLHPLDCPGQAIQAAVGDAIQNFANAVLEMFGKVVSALGTIWLSIGTPNLTDSGGSSAIRAGSAAPGSGNVVTVLGYATWVGLAIAAIAMIWLGVLVAASVRRGDGALSVGRMGLVLGGVVLVAGAGSLVAGVLPAGPRGAGGATLFIQSALWWYMGALAVLSVVVAGVRMAWENRADPGKDLIKSLLTLLVVAGAGVTFTQLLITASDSFAVWVLQGSLKCDVSSNQACFGRSVAELLALGANPSTGGGLGAMLVIILGIIASLAAALQIVLMVARGGLLVILAGILPFSAAATNLEAGRGWFRKCVGWLIAFLAYKPAAAVAYAAAFQLIGTNVFSSRNAVVSILTGLMLMILALVALPALMRFVTPLVGALASGAGGGAAAAGAVAALPTGAAQVGRLVGGGGFAVAGGSSSQPSGAALASGGGGGSSVGRNGQSGPSGADGAGGSTGGGGRGLHSVGASGAGSSSAGAAGGPTQAAAQAAQGTAGAAGSGAGTGAAAARGAATGGAAGGGAAGGAAAAGGPFGVAAAEGARRVGEASQAAASAARGAAQDVTGEGDGPSGNS